jgi:hypothetical protein
MGHPLWHGGSSPPQRVPWRLVTRVWGVAALSRGCWAILAPSTATGETCGHGGPESWSVGWIVQLSVASS